jgi:hypothetical protein
MALACGEGECKVEGMEESEGGSMAALLARPFTRHGLDREEAHDEEM